MKWLLACVGIISRDFQWLVTYGASNCRSKMKDSFPQDKFCWRNRELGIILSAYLVSISLKCHTHSHLSRNPGHGSLRQQQSEHATNLCLQQHQPVWKCCICSTHKCYLSKIFYLQQHSPVWKCCIVSFINVIIRWLTLPSLYSSKINCFLEDYY